MQVESFTGGEKLTRVLENGESVPCIIVSAQRDDDDMDNEFPDRSTPGRIGGVYSQCVDNHGRKRLPSPPPFTNRHLQGESS